MRAGEWPPATPSLRDGEIENDTETTVSRGGLRLADVRIWRRDRRDVDDA
jgi:hypothetical protein